MGLNSLGPETKTPSGNVELLEEVLLGSWVDSRSGVRNFFRVQVTSLRTPTGQDDSVLRVCLVSCLKRSVVPREGVEETVSVRKDILSKVAHSKGKSDFLKEM